MADAVRIELQMIGVILEDKKDGTTSYRNLIMRRREFIKKSAVVGAGAYAATKLGMPVIATNNGGTS